MGSANDLPPSKVMHRELDELMIARLLPRPEASGAWLGSADGFPRPCQDEVVILLPFFVRGLGFPYCDFLRQLLDFYRIELVHLNPNSILQILVLGFISMRLSLEFLPPSIFSAVFSGQSHSQMLPDYWHSLATD
jgi:hypothetical protein